MPTKRKSGPKDSSMTGSDIYIKRRQADGTSVVAHHRVWDGERFFNNELKAAQAEGLEILLSSKAEYKGARR